MNNKKSLFAILITLTLLMFCKKEPIITDSNLLTNELISYDTKDSNLIFSINTVEADSILSIYSLKKLGNINDSKFGKVFTELNCQLILSGNNIDFKFESTNSLNDLAVDSIILYLDYNNYYGKATEQEFVVTEINEDLDIDNNYMSDYVVNLTSNILSQPNQKHTPNFDTINYDGVLATGVLKIKLDKSFGDKILAKSGSTELSNSTNFLSFFKGINIKSIDNISNNEGAILDINISSTSLSKVRLYYSDTLLDTSKYYDLKINNLSANTNFIKHDYTGSDVESKIGQVTSDYAYIKGLNGLMTGIDLSNSIAFNTKRLINRADLVLKIEEDFEEFDPSSIVNIYYKIDGEYYNITDYSTNGSSNFIDYSYDTTNNIYRLNIARFINKINTGDIDTKKIYIETSSTQYNSSRSLINIKESYLGIIYTDIQ